MENYVNLLIVYIYIIYSISKETCGVCTLISLPFGLFCAYHRAYLDAFDGRSSCLFHVFISHISYFNRILRRIISLNYFLHFCFHPIISRCLFNVNLLGRIHGFKLGTTIHWSYIHSIPWHTVLARVYFRLNITKRVSLVF